MNYNGMCEAVFSTEKLIEASTESYLGYISSRLSSLFEENGVSVLLDGDCIHIGFNDLDLYDLGQLISWVFMYRDEAEDRLEDIGNYSGDFEVRGTVDGIDIVAKRL